MKNGLVPSRSTIQPFDLPVHTSKLHEKQTKMYTQMYTLQSTLQYTNKEQRQKHYQATYDASGHKQMYKHTAHERAHAQVEEKTASAQGADATKAYTHKKADQPTSCDCAI